MCKRCTEAKLHIKQHTEREKKNNKERKGNLTGVKVETKALENLRLVRERHFVISHWSSVVS